MFLKDAEIGFAENNSVRILRGLFNIQACNTILIVPQYAIINKQKKKTPYDHPFKAAISPHIGEGLLHASLHSPPTAASVSTTVAPPV